MANSGDDVLADYQRKLGKEFGTVFHGLWNGWAWCVMRRDEYRALFTKAEDVSLLNEITGGGLTWDIQTIFWDDLLLRVSRLTDPPRSAGKRNLTVKQLPMFCKERCELLHEKVERLVEEADKKAQFARDWRNRRISHSDLATLRGQAAPLAPASLEDVTAALDAIHAILTEISLELMCSGIINEISNPPRARAFLVYARQLVESVKFIDAAIDPDGDTKITDIKTATDFLERLGLEPSMPNIRRVIELRESARRFSS